MISPYVRISGSDKAVRHAAGGECGQGICFLAVGPAAARRRVAFAVGERFRTYEGYEGRFELCDLISNSVRPIHTEKHGSGGVPFLGQGLVYRRYKVSEGSAINTLASMGT